MLPALKRHHLTSLNPRSWPPRILTLVRTDASNKTGSAPVVKMGPRICIRGKASDTWHMALPFSSCSMQAAVFNVLFLTVVQSTSEKAHLVGKTASENLSWLESCWKSVQIHQPVQADVLEFGRPLNTQHAQVRAWYHPQTGSSYSEGGAANLSLNSRFKQLAKDSWLLFLEFYSHSLAQNRKPVNI